MSREIFFADKETALEEVKFINKNCWLETAKGPYPVIMTVNGVPTFQWKIKLKQKAKV